MESYELYGFDSYVEMVNKAIDVKEDYMEKTRSELEDIVEEYTETVKRLDVEIDISSDPELKEKLEVERHEAFWRSNIILHLLGGYRVKYLGDFGSKERD